MEKIYKSCTPGISHEQFKQNGCYGTSTFVGYERLLKTSIYEAISKKEKEIMKGMVIDIDGITVYFR